jgi:opacity protein-like surface antigen
MKIKSIALLIVLIVIAEKGQAQVQFGLKAGINYVNNVFVNNPSGNEGDNQYRFGYHAGVFGKVGFSNKFSLRPELLFSNKGHKFAGQAGSQPAGDGSIHLNYINLPLLAGYEIFDGLIIMLGPEIGYLLSAKSKFESETIDVKNNFDNNFDFGLATGFSYSLNEKIILDVRYTHGFSSVFAETLLTDENGVPINNSVVKFQNRTLQLSACYRLTQNCH